jgi:hypothetical protein
MVGKKDTSLAQFAKGSKLRITSRARLNPLRDVGEERHFPGAVCEGRQTADNKQSEVEPFEGCRGRKTLPWRSLRRAANCG